MGQKGQVSEEQCFRELGQAEPREGRRNQQNKRKAVFPLGLVALGSPRLGHLGGEWEAQLPLFWQENLTFNALPYLADFETANMVRGEALPGARLAAQQRDL